VSAMGHIKGIKNVRKVCFEIILDYKFTFSLQTHNTTPLP